MDRRLLLPWILMLVLENLADGALTWSLRPPSQETIAVDLTRTNPCGNSLYTFSVDGAEDSLQFNSFTQNPNGQFIVTEDKLYCSEAALKTNGHSSYTLSLTITDGVQPSLVDTFTVTIIGLSTTTAQTTTASTTSATAASTTQVTSSSKPACGNLSWNGPPPSQRFPSVNFSSTQPNPCKDSIYTFSVCGARDQLKISITQNPDGKFITSADRLYCTDATLLRNNGYSSYNLTVTITDGIQPPLVDTFTLGINSEAGGMIVSMVTLIGCLLISKLE